MTEIKPFPGIIYNYKKVRQPSKVICPPYDIITSIEAKTYQRLSRYNMIHLTVPCDAFGQRRYQKVSLRFHNWLKKGILLQDKEPAIYFYQQEFKTVQMKNFAKGKTVRFKRLGFIARLSLHNSSSIYGHEHTRIEPKEDRFELLEKVEANLEPIFVLFSDPKQLVQNIFRRYALPSRPLVCFRDQEKNMNKLFRITKPATLKKIKERMRNKILFIADGHHRYEVSLNYQNLMQERLKLHSPGGEDFNYIMAYFCPIQSPGLVIMPVHRLVKQISNFPTDRFKKFFSIQKTTRRELFGLLQSPVPKPRLIGMYSNRDFYILKLINEQILKGIDKDYRSLDVCLLNHLVLKKLLGVKPEDRQRIIASSSVPDLIRQADMDKASLVFFIKPVRISDIIYLAKANKKMPAKTTYFYPKIPSGLVIYKFSDK